MGSGDGAGRFLDVSPSAAAASTGVAADVVGLLAVLAQLELLRVRVCGTTAGTS